jgi:hypothetical protein
MEYELTQKGKIAYGKVRNTHENYVRLGCKWPMNETMQCECSNVPGEIGDLYLSRELMDDQWEILAKYGYARRA